MTEPETTRPSAPAESAGHGVELITQPASFWHRKVDALIEELAARRQELRQQIQTQRNLRCAHNPLGEASLSSRQARQVAKDQILGPPWQRARLALKQAGHQQRSARRQLQRCRTERRIIRECSRPYFYWLLKAPYLALLARPLRRRLRQATQVRRTALKALRAQRPQAAEPRVREQIFVLTQQLLLHDERLGHNLQSLQGADQSISLQISEALRLAPQLRALGHQPVTMEQMIDPAARKLSLPKPTHPLLAASPVARFQPGLRMG